MTDFLIFTIKAIMKKRTKKIRMLISENQLKNLVSKLAEKIKNN
jgi:hypothetical protein